MTGPAPMTVRFEPGEGVAIVGHGAVCLVLDDPRSELVDQLRSVLGDGDAVDSVLEAMVRTGGLDLPPFGLVTVEGRQARVVVRGPVTVLLEGADPAVQLTGDRVRTWVEHVAEDVRRVRIRAGSADQTEGDELAFETAGGIVPARTVDLVFVPSEELADREDSSSRSHSTVDGVDAVAQVHVPGLIAISESDGPEVDDLEPVTFAPDETSFAPADEPDIDDATELTQNEVEPEPLDSELDDEPPPDERERTDDGPWDPPTPPSVPPTPIAGGPPIVVDRHTLVEPLDLPSDDDIEGSRPDDLPVVTDNGSESIDASDDYDHLFGATQFRTIEQAAVRPAEEQADSPQLKAPMISGVPGGDATVRPPSDPGDLEEVVADEGDHDGHTVSMASLRAQLKGASPAPVPGVGPAVHAVQCPSGHLNPTHVGTCRVCGVPIQDQEHVSVPRPVLGTFTFNDGRVVSVSRPLLIGRSPSAEGALAGESPELVVVSSPLTEVSSTHVEVRLEGWQVLVVDRQSTNGTVIKAPGRDPQRLRPGEPVPITPGTTVVLADEAEFTFEASE